MAEGGAGGDCRDHHREQGHGKPGQHMADAKRAREPIQQRAIGEQHQGGKTAVHIEKPGHRLHPA